MDESSLPEPSPRAPDWFQSSPSIGWTLELDDHVKSVTMTSYPDHFNPSVSAKLRADGEILLVNFWLSPYAFPYRCKHKIGFKGRYVSSSKFYFCVVLLALWSFDSFF